MYDALAYYLVALGGHYMLSALLLVFVVMVKVRPWVRDVTVKFCAIFISLYTIATVVAYVWKDYL